MTVATERTGRAKSHFIHGMRHSKIYTVWCNMKARCNNPNDKRYDRYGGRGIKICPEWENSFIAFYTWAMESGYQENLTIDRIDNNRGYSPDNCRWATRAEQNRNFSGNHLITYQGRTQCLTDWANELGISLSCIRSRIKRGWPDERLLDKRDWRYMPWQKKRQAYLKR